MVLSLKISNSNILIMRKFNYELPVLLVQVRQKGRRFEVIPVNFDCDAM